MPRAMLDQNLPNPFNPLTSIHFVLPTSGRVTLQVFDSAGRHVRTLVNDALPEGSHQAVWNGRDDEGHRVASGIYLYRLDAGAFQQSRKMVLLK
jgi:flagellar hook assembly protein FlgD